MTPKEENETSMRMAMRKELGKIASESHSECVAHTVNEFHSLFYSHDDLMREKERPVFNKTRKKDTGEVMFKNQLKGE